MLYFQPVEDFGTANPIIEMVISDFDIELTEDTKNLVYFNIKTFSTLTSKKQDKDPETGELYTGPGVAFDVANNFLAGLTMEEQEKVAIAFLHAHLEIRCGAADASDIDDVEDKVAVILDELDLAIDICRKTEDYVRTANIPIADFSEAGTRPQDSADMTFVAEEAIIITAITVFMKVISPIIGAFISKYAGIIDNDHKESHARAMLTLLHRRKYNKLLVKLHYYISKLVEGKLKFDATSMYNGVTLAHAARHAVDMAIIKRLVCVSLYRRDGNIIKYLASCGRGSTESQQKNIASTNAAKIIADPVEQERDEGNQSRMEVESRQSVKTADIPILLNVAARNIWRTTVEREGLDMEQIETAQAFYRRNPVVVNIISQYLLCMYYGPDLGGGSSILHLNSSTISDLSATLQVLLAQSGAPMLAHALTINVSESPRLPQKDDYLFVNGWTSMPEFTECKKLLPAGFGDKEWNGRLKDIATFLIQRILVYNTAPVVWDIIDSPSKNGKIFGGFLPLMNELMKFVSLTYAKGKTE